MIITGPKFPVENFVLGINGDMYFISSPETEKGDATAECSFSHASKLLADFLENRWQVPLDVYHLKPYANIRQQGAYKPARQLNPGFFSIHRTQHVSVGSQWPL